MFKNRRGQSTAEYAIVFALVVAVVAGVFSAMVKGGMRNQMKKATGLLAQAGNNTTEYFNASGGELTFTKEARVTTIDKGDFVDTTAMAKGGAELKVQNQTATTASATIETVNATGQ